VVDDFIETMTIERNKQKINKMLNAKKIQDWIDKIKTTEKDPKYYEQALSLLPVGMSTLEPLAIRISRTIKSCNSTSAPLNTSYTLARD
jgi:hypothetical protein